MKSEEPAQPDPDMVNATAALLRAAKRARLLAQQTGTEFIVVRDGKVVREIPSEDHRTPSVREDSNS